ncbi:MAG: AAA family ATPase, partial [Candidatus Aminicenantes bacterium]|nr:AAA family ATPase [Candidatus Aminicenantes bacterium]
MAEENKTKAPESIYKHIDRLYLDPNNYRLIDHPEYRQVPDDKISDPLVQKRTRSLILGRNNENVKDLIDSFKENGYLPVDQIQVKKIKSDYFLVLEGNRRVATLKYLFEEWKEHGIDIGKLKESSFKYVPLILHPEESVKMHLIVMGLKHISGNKKWNPVNQAQYIEDLFTKKGMTEDVICNSLGITKNALRRARRILALINLYKESDYGDQFESQKYSFFEEVIRSIDLKQWLEWNDDEFIPRNKSNMERFFSWISQEEVSEYDESEEPVEKRILEPIITKSQEIRDLAKYINDENALKKMEENRSVTEGYAFSDAVGESKFTDALEKFRENTYILYKYSDYMKSDTVDELIRIRDKIDRLIPTKAYITAGSLSPQLMSPLVESHFSSITISRFRRLENFVLEKLNRINIFAGLNNSGKTSVLEAVYLLANFNNIHAFIEMERNRAKFSEDIPPKWLEINFLSHIELAGVFNEAPVKVSIESGQTTEPIDKSGYLTTIELYSWLDKEEREARIHLYSDKDRRLYYDEKAVLCNSIMTTPYRLNESFLHNAHAKAFKEKKIDIIIDFIKEAVDSTIQDIQMIDIAGVKRFFVTSERFDKSIDITNYGEGVQRVFQIGLFLAYASNGVLLIDEFETAIHKNLLIDFSR